MTTIGFDAFDYHSDQSFVPATYKMTGSTERGWRIERDGVLALELGPGYRALRVRQCGVCSTDLARHFLPFPLPQVIGHEVVAVDDQGQRYVVEINASHVARDVPHDCAFCRAGLSTHCPDRVTLGIHDLPGGFGPWILAPVAACIAVPEAVPDSAAVLVEPFAAALHAVTTIAPSAAEHVAVLGPRRLGMLVIAALAAVRARDGSRFRISAVLRDPRLAALAADFGADDSQVVAGENEPGLEQAFDVVIDTTGAALGLERAVRMARREVHLKSTHGQLACGVRHLTELVVDELAIARFEAPLLDDGCQVAWLAAAEPTPDFVALYDAQRGAAEDLFAHFDQVREGLPRADVAVVDSIAGVEAAIRPVEGREVALVRPRGQILVHPQSRADGSPLLAAVLERGLRLSSSRCGDFRAALRLLDADAELRRVGDRLVTHHFAARELADAFAVARSRDCIKAVVAHDR